MSVKLNCPLCGEVLSVHSPTLCAVVEKHAPKCRKMTAVPWRSFVVAAPPPEQAAKHLESYHRQVIQLHARLAESDNNSRRLRREHACAMETSSRENATLRGEVERLRGDVTRLRREVDRLESQPPPTTDPGGKRLICALRRITASTSRRRKLLALLHPDFLKDPTLLACAKLVREAVELE